MFEDLNNQLINAKEKLRNKQKYDNLVNQTRKALKNEKDQKLKLNIILEDEDKDVKKLESLSITGLFYSVLGSKQKQLEKERQELLSARLKYDESCSSVVVLEQELASYEAELNGLIGAEVEYEEVMKRKEAQILQSNDINAQKLIQFIDKSASLEVMNKEIHEAIEAGEDAQNQLTRVISSLDSAEGWGTWDMLGGGFIATAAKHSHIDEAKQYAHSTKNALRRFQNELSDVALTMNVDINIGSFETFADYFFDGLISDWIVQSRINESLANVQSVNSNVNSILHTLRQKYNSVQNELASTKEEMKFLIEQV